MSQNITATSNATLNVKIGASIEAVLVEEERLIATRGVRSARLRNCTSIMVPNAPYFVIESNGSRTSLPAEDAIKRGHPIARAQNGETISYPSDFGRVTMTRVGIFELVGAVDVPGERWNKITLMAEMAAA